MSADPIIYCLERISDYRDFERLCSALLAGCGYSSIDPLGGTGDEGRDAIIRAGGENRTVFAYTVRSDWRAKLKADCSRIQQAGHDPIALVFACTETLTASEKDWAHRLVREDFGWNFELYDLERLRVQLVGPQRHLIAQHPSIFTPPFFPHRGGRSLEESKDTLLIDHVSEDHALAAWLSRALSLAGYQTWCLGTAPLAGEDVDDTVRKLLEARAVQFLPVISDASLADRTFVERCALAAAKADFTLPCSTILRTDERMPTRLAKVSAADFSSSWKKGGSQVIDRLGGLGIKPAVDSAKGRSVALGGFLPSRVTTEVPERVFANAFPAQLPRLMLTYDLRQRLSEPQEAELRRKWAFATLNSSQIASFTPPPAEAGVVTASMKNSELLWRDLRFREGVRLTDLAKQLVWRSLWVACARKGLAYCDKHRGYYFPVRENADWVQPFRHVDGRATTVKLTGVRTKGYGDRASPFSYQLSPRFSPQWNDDGEWTVAVSIYVRSTTFEGVPFEGKEIARRRKVVGKSWWNQQWLARLLGVVQALETSPGKIEVGEEGHAFVMSTQPLEWSCPVGLDIGQLAGIAELGEELASLREEIVDDEDDAAGLSDDVEH